MGRGPREESEEDNLGVKLKIKVKYENSQLLKKKNPKTFLLLISNYGIFEGNHTDTRYYHDMISVFDRELGTDRLQ